MEIKATARKWGSSIGIIIPKKIVDKRGIKENDTVTIEIKTKPLAKDLFGKFPGIKGGKTTQQIKDELRKGWD